MESLWRYTPDIFGLLLSFVVQWQLFGWIAGWVRPRWRTPVLVLRVVVSAWVTLAFLFSLPPVYRYIPTGGWRAWAKAFGMGWAIIAAVIWGIEWTFRLLEKLWPAFDPSRRQALGIVRNAALAAPAATIGYGVFIGRHDFRLREIEIPVRGLAKDLHGLRMVQLTDIHMSPFLSATDLEHAIGIANEAKAHVALMTGDLISVKGDPLDDCIRLLARIKTDAGLIGCLGNHEIVADCEEYVTSEAARSGMRFLRSEAHALRFGNARINFAGVDYQRKGKPYLPDAEALIEPATFNVLLSHNPDVFPVAARMGYDLTIAGHTHGGQVTVEILHQYANIARFYTPYVYGHYEEFGRSAYVSRGLGTIGIPARVGAPPEVALIKLCAT
ncbi:MAG: metallophosphoesterase [Bryobacteraceae bacterium]